MDEVSLTTVAGGLDAEMICRRLRLEGIRCFYRLTGVGNAWAGCMAPVSGPVEIIIDAVDLERARELLELGNDDRS